MNSWVLHKEDLSTKINLSRHLCHLRVKMEFRHGNVIAFYLERELGLIGMNLKYLITSFHFETCQFVSKIVEYCVDFL